jgi:rhodanese-related sulfurtransferase
MDLKKTIITLGGAAAFLMASIASADIVELSSQEAADLVAQGDYYILDVRTDSEWTWVGHPGENRAQEGGYLDGKVVNISYLIEKVDGSTTENQYFVHDVLREFKGDRSVNLIAMCRSGSRSLRAAEALEAAGFTSVYNMTYGFEGDRDASGYRTVNGWKVEGYPYTDGRDGAYTLEVYLRGGGFDRLLQYLFD